MLTDKGNTIKKNKISPGWHRKWNKYEQLYNLQLKLDYKKNWRNNFFVVSMQSCKVLILIPSLLHAFLQNNPNPLIFNIILISTFTNISPFNTTPGKLFDIPIKGTHAHSFVSSFKSFKDLHNHVTFT